MSCLGETIKVGLKEGLAIFEAANAIFVPLVKSSGNDLHQLVFPRLVYTQVVQSCSAHEDRSDRDKEVPVLQFDISEELKLVRQRPERTNRVNLSGRHKGVRSFVQRVSLTTE